VPIALKVSTYKQFNKIEPRLEMAGRASVKFTDSAIKGGQQIIQ